MHENKILVISDIHGSLSAAKLMEEAIKKHEPDHILCLGDVLYHGPRNDLPADYAPKQVIPVMNTYAAMITGVRGNCDAEVDQMVLDFPLLADYNVIHAFCHRIFCSHGHVYGPKALPKLSDGDVFLSGHTHVPTVIHDKGIYLWNPGSSALPKEGHPKSYAVIDDSGFTVFAADHTPYMHCDW